ncbi:MAG: 3-deoxy-D-manno-octulosonic acid transferase [endosymbiont of Seepiophila jonesi]|uniref:3-deoxy-D-manno-octulosonic acid transferase n=1 Tax=endosymbiont of Lamellibrachia luymesi TaxID=2200907 RepID=A0A370E283_9GAMM|nr:MAG: 3-deoxy-D-manno-octulosonic acid transferase [endosymbiont of Seepiophila jonesi]RDH92601.1 MAG: 3-deoxy-D-manno-octulosonic acid transferase [endosymbiont of Lamellibrachia luymesi]
MRNIYSLLLYLIMPLVVVRLYWRSLKSPAYRERWLERFGWFDSPVSDGCIWLHAVSVGEVQAAAQLVKRLLADYPGLPLVITTTTPTGAKQVESLFGQDVFHHYAPYDAPWVVKTFFDRLQPRLLILIETEIWPNLLHECRQRSIPSLLANARMSTRSALRYRHLAGLTRETLQNISLIAAQGESDAEHFQVLGARPGQVEVTGSIKFDIKLPASLREQADVIRRDWGQARPVWVAASTHEGEDELVLAAHAKVRETLPESLLVLVPRHPERFDRVAELAISAGFDLVRRSEQCPCRSETAVFLGDSMGELAMFLGAADMAFIGGSLVPHGGHNILEAAAQGVPVVFGPHMFNFAEISRLFLDRGAAREVVTAETLAEVSARWLSDASERSLIGERGRDLVEQNRGAMQRLRDIVARLFSETAV